jgi:uncharacterized protein (DUF362 family)
MNDRRIDGMTADVTRRAFLDGAARAVAGAALGSTLSKAAAGSGLDPYVPPIDLAVARGGSPAKNCLAAVDALGGFAKFVRAGDRVAIKPNPVGGNSPERGVNTHPEMIEAVVRECLRVGAAEVTVVSHDDARSFAANGTAAAVERAGGKLQPLRDRGEFREIIVPRGRTLRRVAIATSVLSSDVFINMPIAKHHVGSRFTATMKNLMGANWDRAFFHRTDLHRCIAELTSAVRHDLIILDANHVLLTNGPAGPGDTSRPGQVVAGVDPVAVDAFATRYLGIKPEDVPHIGHAHALGVGEIDLGKLRIREFDA